MLNLGQNTDTFNDFKFYLYGRVWKKLLSFTVKSAVLIFLKPLKKMFYRTNYSRLLATTAASFLP